MKRWHLLALLGLIMAAAFILLKHIMDRARKMIAPVSGPVTSPYGDRVHPVTGERHFHNGVDYAVPVGTDVVAPFDGEVTARYSNDVGGLQLIVKHTNGYTSGFAHLSDALVSVGDTVGKGQVIARTGQTGRVTGPHLHYTLRAPSNEYADPVPLLT